MHNGRAWLIHAGLTVMAVLGLVVLMIPATQAQGAASPGPDELGQVGSAVTAVTPPAFPAWFAEQPQAVTLAANQEGSCSTATEPGDAECMAIAQTGLPSLTGVQPAASLSGYSPANLQTAYGLTSASASGGTANGLPETIAVVTSYDDTAAAADLAIYRSEWGLPACDTSTGAGCVTKVNEDNQTSPLPQPPPAGAGDWTFETSADLDMVSAVCPNCRILLFEAGSTQVTDMGQAEVSAENDADFVSNSWGSPEFFGESADDIVYFGNDAGKAIVFAAGNNGYGTTWPAVSPYVTAVGGTTLTANSSVARGYTETAWSDAGSGCAIAEAKPSWQTADDTSPNGCLNRTENDVAAVADPNTGVAVYDSTADDSRAAGWGVAGGTGVAASIVTGTYALAGLPDAGTLAASYPYQSGHTADLNAVTSGSNGTCDTNRTYLCDATTGYNGPTGLGTPDGTGAFATSGAGDLVTVMDPGTQDYAASGKVNIPIEADDSTSGMTLTYTATGLPNGATINSGTGLISGTLGTGTGTSAVTVTASDGAGSGSVRFNIVVVPSLDASYHVSVGPVNMTNFGGDCIDDNADSTANGAKVQLWSCLGNANQNWNYIPDASPGGAGEVQHDGKCLDATNQGTANGTLLQLWSCSGGANQQWAIGGNGELINPISERCVTDPGAATADGTQLELYTCSSAAYQQWILPSSPIQSGVSAMCVDNSAGALTEGNTIQIYGCLGNTNQKWFVHSTETLQTGGMCMDINGPNKLEGTVVHLWDCYGATNQHWVPGPQGQIENVYSGLCLDDPGNSTTDGTQLVQEPCYGEPGEVWAET